MQLKTEYLSCIIGSCVLVLLSLILFALNTANYFALIGVAGGALGIFYYTWLFKALNKKE